jgi:hypothetical protein
MGYIMLYNVISGWWVKNNLEKYDFVNGKDDIPYMKWKIKNVPNHQPYIYIIIYIHMKETERYNMTIPLSLFD